MNESKISYYTKLGFRMLIALGCWLWLIHLVWKIQDLSILVKGLLFIGLIGAMILNVYNGRENRYYDFKQSLEQLNQLDEGRFTYFIQRLYRTLGYYTQMPLTKEMACHEIILRLEDQVILLHCYNKPISLKEVQALVGKLGSLKKPMKGALLTTHTVSEEVSQLMTLNHITLVQKDTLMQYMLEARTFLENDLDNALSAALCHPVSWFYAHFLEDEPRFMHTANWQEWVVLKLKNKGYQVSKTEKGEQYGVHFVAYKGEVQLAIWCIGVEGKVTIDMLQALKASLPYYKVNEGLIITNGKCGHKERRFAEQLGLKVLDLKAFYKF